ncbi:MAG TPA: site-2 protease family protein [Pyrinomonadaceae bacterium]|nr:site-2 protease family protein [Pyrinomonadaceae bacterium]
MSESVQGIPTFLSGAGVWRRAARPTAREWRRHGALFLLTALTAAWAGTAASVLASGSPPVPELAAPSTPLEYTLYLPRYILLELLGVGSYALSHPAHLAEGALFAGALLFILLAHEAGHYVACRLYGVDATLPFFIPMPPPFMAGTLGAFIRIKSPIPSRRALFDIGVAGPLAGFAALVPVALAGLLAARPFAGASPEEGVIVFNDPPLVRLLAALLGVEDLAGLALNPLSFAAWIGLLVTSLNLLPVGQLDGGHATYALFGARAHRAIGRLAFLSVLLLAPLGWLWHGSPSGFLYAALLFVMLRVRHPQAESEHDPLGRPRALVALLTLLVFALSFTPFPLTIK